MQLLAIGIGLGRVHWVLYAINVYGLFLDYRCNNLATLARPIRLALLLVTPWDTSS